MHQKHNARNRMRVDQLLRGTKTERRPSKSGHDNRQKSGSTWETLFTQELDIAEEQRSRRMNNSDAMGVSIISLVPCN